MAVFLTFTVIAEKLIPSALIDVGDELIEDNIEETGIRDTGGVVKVIVGLLTKAIPFTVAVI